MQISNPFDEAQQITDQQLLALCLRQRQSQQSAEALAARLLNQFKSLHGVFSATSTAIHNIEGMGQSRERLLHAMREINQRALREQIQARDLFDHVDKTRQFIQASLQHETHECFAVLLMDSQNRMISFKVVFRGTINMAPVYPRELVKLVLEHNAASIILAHNHPSGVAEPSQADINITNRICDAMALIDVNVLDHFVIGAGTAVSLSQRGLL